MAKCGHCGGVGTRTQQISPTGGAYKQIAIVCSNISCSAILGVTDFYNTGAQVQKLEKKIDGLAQGLSALQRDLQEIDRKLQRR